MSRNMKAGEICRMLYNMEKELRVRDTGTPLGNHIVTQSAR